MAIVCLFLILEGKQKLPTLAGLAVKAVDAVAHPANRCARPSGLALQILAHGKVDGLIVHLLKKPVVHVEDVAGYLPYRETALASLKECLQYLPFVVHFHYSVCVSLAVAVRTFEK